MFQDYDLVGNLSVCIIIYLRYLRPAPYQHLLVE